MLDTANANSPYVLDLTTDNGDLVVPDFSLLSFSSIDIASSGGDISVGRILVTGPFKVYGSRGAINVTNIISPTIMIDGNNGPVFMFGVTTGLLDVSTSNAAITAQTLLLTSVIGCDVSLQTTNGEVTLGLVTLPLTANCVISISTSNGPVSMTILNFSGKYDLSTSNGQATITDGNCSGSECAGEIPGRLSHNLAIISSNGNITVTIVQT